MPALQPFAVASHVRRYRLFDFYIFVLPAVARLAVWMARALVVLLWEVLDMPWDPDARYQAHGA